MHVHITAMSELLAGCKCFSTFGAGFLNRGIYYERNSCMTVHDRGPVQSVIWIEPGPEVS
jgi:hypothetical protein